MTELIINGNRIDLDNLTMRSNENSLATTEPELDNMSVILAKESEDLSKQIKAVSLLSDIKTVESFGYKATEGVMDTVKNAATTIWNKIIDFIKKIINFITSVVQGGIIKRKVDELLKRVDSSAIFAASANFKIEWPTENTDDLNRYMSIANKYLATIETANNSDELKELFTVSNRLTQGNAFGYISIDEAFKRLGIRAFKGGTFGGDGINRTFSKEIHEFLVKLRDGSSEYLYDLKQSNDLAKRALKKSLEMARNNSDAKKANEMQAIIRILNQSSRMYTKYVSATLSILEMIYSVQTFAQPGTPAYNEWLAKQKRNRTILVIAGCSLALAGAGAAIASSPVAAATVANVAKKIVNNGNVRNLAKSAVATSTNTASRNVTNRVTNHFMNSLYQEES